MYIFFCLLYFFSGLIKSVFMFYGIKFPVDFTALSASLLFIYIFYDYILLKNKIKINRKYVLVSSFLLLFYIWILISLIYTPSKEYSIKKAFYFSTNIIAFIYPLFVRNFNVKSFLKPLVIISLIFAVWYLGVDLKASSYIYNSAKFHVYAASYLIISFLLGINVLVCITSEHNLFGNKRNDFIIAFISVGIMLMIRGRGPLIFVFIVMIIFLLKKLLFKRNIFLTLNINNMIKTGIILIGFTVLLIAVFTRFQDQIISMVSVTVSRLELLFSGIKESNMGKSVDIRLEHIDNSFNLIFNNVGNFFSGYGIGSYGILTTGGDIKDYPHNILLEIMTELGFIGLFLFFLYLFFNFIYFKKHNRYISYFLILYIFLNMLKSSSLIDIRMYFMFFALFLINPKKNILKTDEN